MPPAASETDPPASLRLVLGTLLLALAGRVVHDLEEFATLSPDWPVAGLLIPAGLTWAWFRWGRRQPWLAWALIGWLLVNAVIGGVLTVLPLGILPFEPAQTTSHYLAHLVYTASQLPLSWVAWRSREPGRAHPGRR